MIDILTAVSPQEISVVFALVGIWSDARKTLPFLITFIPVLNILIYITLPTL